MDWAALPIQHIPLGSLVWPCHDISPEHTHPGPDAVLSSGPIHVQRLIDGSHYIHDGRHRAIRAGLAGHTYIAAHVHP